jgi:ribosomal-protein-alanine N-acetyltransferase
LIREGSYGIASVVARIPEESYCMNPYQSPRRDRSDAGSDGDIALPTTIRSLSETAEVIGRCQDAIGQLASQCENIEKLEQPLRKAEEKWQVAHQELQDTEAAYQKEAATIERCQWFMNRRQGAIERLQLHINLSLRHLVQSSHQMASELRAVDPSTSILVRIDFPEATGHISLHHFQKVMRELQTVHNSVFHFLRGESEETSHPHVLRRFSGQRLEPIALSLACDRAELRRVERAVSWVQRMEQWIQSKTGEVKESRGFAAAFFGELESMRSSAEHTMRTRDSLHDEYQRNYERIETGLDLIGNQIIDVVRMIAEHAELSAVQRDTMKVMHQSLLEQVATPQRGVAVRQRLNTWASALDEVSSVLTTHLSSQPLVLPAAALPMVRPMALAVTVEYPVPKYMAEVLRIENDCFEKPWTERDFADFLQAENRFLWCAMDEGQLRGFLCGADYEGRVEIISLAVDPQYRRRGIGRQLIQHVARNLEAQAQTLVSLVVRESAVDAQQFFSRCGFKAVGYEHNFFGDGEEMGYRMEYPPAQ